MEKPKLYTMPFATVYPLYLEKAKRKGRTKDEVDEIIFWLTGYDDSSLAGQIGSGADMETFFNQAPAMNPDAAKIRGAICGYRVEEIADEMMRNIRCLDKLIDELAHGKAMEKILRR